MVQQIASRRGSTATSTSAAGSWRPPTPASWLWRVTGTPSGPQLVLAREETGNAETAGEGLCMYDPGRLGVADGLYVINVYRNTFRVRMHPITDADKDGLLLVGKPVRDFYLATEGEGCEVDDATGALFLAEEDAGIWRYDLTAPTGLEPPRTSSPPLASNLSEDVEGVALTGGVLYASAQNGVAPRRTGTAASTPPPASSWAASGSATRPVPTTATRPTASTPTRATSTTPSRKACSSARTASTTHPARPAPRTSSSPRCTWSTGWPDRPTLSRREGTAHDPIRPRLAGRPARPRGGRPGCDSHVTDRASERGPGRRGGRRSPHLLLQPRRPARRLPRRRSTRCSSCPRCGSGWRPARRYTQTFVADPSCCPSRASLMTGRYPHNNGVQNQQDGPKFDGPHSMACYLRDGRLRDLPRRQVPHHLAEDQLPPCFDHSTVIWGGYNNVAVRVDGSRPHAHRLLHDRTSATAAASTSPRRSSGTKPFLLYETPQAPHWANITNPDGTVVAAGRPGHASTRARRSAPAPACPRPTAATSRPTSAP